MATKKKTPAKKTVKKTRGVKAKAKKATSGKTKPAAKKISVKGIKNKSSQQKIKTAKETKVKSKAVSKKVPVKTIKKKTVSHKAGKTKKDRTMSAGLLNAAREIDLDELPEEVKNDIHKMMEIIERYHKLTNFEFEDSLSLDHMAEVFEKNNEDTAFVLNLINTRNRMIVDFYKRGMGIDELSEFNRLKKSHVMKILKGTKPDKGTIN